MRMTGFFLLLFALLSPAMAGARGFINNAAEWKAIPDGEKASYVRGLNDSVNFVFVDDSLDAAIVKVGRTRCLIEKKVSAQAIVELISTTYTKEATTFANIPPLVVYIAKIGQMCRDTINRQRSEFGLPAQ